MTSLILRPNLSLLHNWYQSHSDLNLFPKLQQALQENSIQNRLLAVMQKPYQMIQVKDATDQEEDLQCKIQELTQSVQVLMSRVHTQVTENRILQAQVEKFQKCSQTVNSEHVFKTVQEISLQTQNQVYPNIQNKYQVLLGCVLKHKQEIKQNSSIQEWKEIQDLIGGSSQEADQVETVFTDAVESCEKVQLPDMMQPENWQIVPFTGEALQGNQTSSKIEENQTQSDQMVQETVQAVLSDLAKDDIFL